MRHGLHQVAQKSTSTGTSEDPISSANVASVSCASPSAIGGPFVGGIDCQQQPSGRNHSVSPDVGRGLPALELRVAPLSEGSEAFSAVLGVRDRFLKDRFVVE